MEGVGCAEADAISVQDGSGGDSAGSVFGFAQRANEI